MRASMIRWVPSLVLAWSVGACGSPSPSPGGVAATAAPAGPTAVEAAETVLGALDAGALGTATFDFMDAERTNWAFTPIPRQGLPMKEMAQQQRVQTEQLLRTSLSPQGYRLAAGIMRLESILGELEEAQGREGARERRDPEMYHLSVFGTPARNGPWGWRFEGHHLSVNVTHLGPHGQVVSPLFMGVNPARVPTGPQAGLRLLAAEEDIARELLGTFSEQQLLQVIIADTTFGDIITGNDPAVAPFALQGLPASEMTPIQQAHLRRLLQVYVGRLSPDAAASLNSRIEAAGFGQLHFAWAGSATRGRPHYYRVHGPTVLIEYDNTQNNANHIHTVLRDLENDFGGDALRRHYAAHALPHNHN